MTSSPTLHKAGEKMVGAQAAIAAAANADVIAEEDF